MKYLYRRTAVCSPFSTKHFFFWILLVLCAVRADGQTNLKVLDLSQRQIRLLERYQKADSVVRIRAIKDSIYTPYKEFWDGYLGPVDAVADWHNHELLARLDQLKKNPVSSQRLADDLMRTAEEMKKLTGYTASGKWYIAYGPAWTDLGGLGKYAMLIDLSHQSNSTNERIAALFPHELTHQIMTKVNSHPDSAAIESVVGEGFAVWINQKYWGTKYRLAENLGYTAAELKACDDNLAALKKLLDKYKYSTDSDVINVFRNRSSRVNAQLPGAIGYYLGYRIVEAYVDKYGPDTWKDVFVKPSRQILEQSGFLTP